MPKSRREFAQRSRGMAYRALWLALNRKLPIPSMPDDWDSSAVYRFNGVAEPLRHFAIARLLDAQRGDPPEMPNEQLAKQAQACIDAATTLDTFENHEARLPLEELGRHAVARLQQAPDDSAGRGLAEVELGMVRGAQRAVFEARQQLGREPPLAPELAAAPDPFPAVLWMDSESREAALLDQAQRLHDHGFSYLEIAHVLGCVSETNEKTADNMRNRLNYRRKQLKALR